MSSKLDIILIGCGGTGSFLVPSIFRTIADIKSEYDIKSQTFDYRILLIDGDVVEPANIERQNFARQDIDSYKAEILAKRYGNHFGLDVSFFNEYLTLDNIENIIKFISDIDRPTKTKKFGLHGTANKIFISCVDNIHCRALVHWLGSLYGRFSPSCVWLDAGNELNYGQIYVGNRYSYNFFTANLYNLERIYDVPDPALACENGGTQSSLANREAANLLDLAFTQLVSEYLASNSGKSANLNSIPIYGEFCLSSHVNFSIAETKLLPTTNLLFDPRLMASRFIDFNMFSMAALKFLEKSKIGKLNRLRSRQTRKLYKKAFQTSKKLETLTIKYA